MTHVETNQARNTKTEKVSRTQRKRKITNQLRAKLVIITEEGRETHARKGITIRSRKENEEITFQSSLQLYIIQPEWIQTYILHDNLNRRGRHIK